MLNIKTKLFLYAFIFLLSLMGFVNHAHAATNVYYSVGQNTNDHQIVGVGSTASISISGTAATFSVGQTAPNMGVGDKVTYSGGSCFISGKSSSTAWTCTNTTGGTAPQVSNVSVTSIAHAFASLSLAIGGTAPGAADANHLNSANLTSSDVVLNIPCYNDAGAADTTQVVINGWTTDATRYLRIYTPDDTNLEANTSQRHNGTRSSSKYRLEVSVNWDASLYIRNDYVRIEGLQIKQTSSFGNGAVTVYPTDNNAATDVRISDTIAYDSAGGYGFGLLTGKVTIMNSIAVGNAVQGFYVTASGSSTDFHFYNTVSAKNGTYGYYTEGYRTINCSNCYAGGNTTADFGKDANGTVNLTTSYSADGSLSSTTAPYTTATFTSVTAGSENVHITASSLLRNKGTNLSGDSYWLHPDGSRDIDGDYRGSIWSVGVDQIPIQIYYSVGQNTGDLKTGSPTLSIDSSGNGTLSADQTGNIGVGDYIEYGTSPYSKAYIAGKTSTTVWAVQSATGASLGTGTTMPVNSIKHTFSTLNGALAGADGANYMNTGNLVTGGYVLNIPCYYDSAADTTAAQTTSDYTTSATNYLKIYTPTNASTEANFSQRHQGKWDDSKYRIEVTNDTGIKINGAANVRVEGIQVKHTATNSNSTYGIVAYDDTATGAQISSNIVKGVITGTSNYVIGIGVCGSTAIDKVWNNIIYDYVNGANQIYGIYAFSNTTNYIYNNTVVNCYIGIENNSSGPNTMTVKNNIVQDCSSSCYGNSYFNSSTTNNITNGALNQLVLGVQADSGTTTATTAGKLVEAGQNFLTTIKIGMIVRNSADNTYTYVTAIDSDTTLSVANDIMPTGKTYIIYNEYYGAVSFADAANDDYHLSPSDTVAKNKGATLSADANLAFSTDIDSSVRPSSSWDIGADDFSSIYRSVGVGATAALAAGAGNNFSIANNGMIGTFATAPGTTIGVGDAIQYDSDGNGSVDSIAFVTARISSTQYVLQKADGTNPTAVTNDQDWGIYRAYTSLSNAEAGTENTGIAAAVVNFDTWSGGKDIIASGEQWNIACYANGTAADTDLVNINGWTTSVPNYIKIYTPTTSTEVGTSQRHQGKWDASKYNLIYNGGGDQIAINTSNVKIIGLQIKYTELDATGWPQIIDIGTATSAFDVDISNNIIFADFSGLTGSYSGAGIIEGWGNNNTLKIYNNIFIDIKSASGAISSAMYLTGGRAYIYNNTIINCARGIYASSTVAIAKNNIAQSCTDGFDGTLSSGTDYNISDIAGDTTGISTSYRNGLATIVDFSDSISDDFHLASTDTMAKNVGADLSADPYLPITNDIDGHTRSTTAVSGAFDIGADEAAAAIYRSVGVGTTAAIISGSYPLITLTISGTTGTFSTFPTSAAFGVGDVVRYDSDNNGTNDSTAFITAINSSAKTMTLEAADGSTPTAMAVGDTDWKIYRAYTSLSNWESGTENTGVGVTYDSGNLDIQTRNEQWNVAAYAPTGGTAPDTTNVNINGWTTGPGKYIKIYSPTASTEVTVSQRHNGKWDSTKYNLKYTAPGSANRAIITNINYVWIDGLQVDFTSSSSNTQAIAGGVGNSSTDNQSEISNCIIRGHGGSGDGINFAGNDADARSKIWNNIVYGFTGGAGINLRGYAYNNTEYNNQYGIQANSSVVKNNLAYNNTDNYYLTFDASSTNNLSGPGTDAQIPSTNKQDGVTIGFSSTVSGAEDFHLGIGDTAAINTGTSLSSDAYLPFSTDVDGQTRNGNSRGWDIGADEAATQVYYSVGNSTSDLKTGSPTLSIDSSGNGTLSVAQTGNMGVGDYIEYGTAPYQKAYITGKTSSTVWTVQGVTGSLLGVASSAPVNSIKHDSSTVAGALTAAANSSHLNTNNIYGNNYALNISCYNDTGAAETSYNTTISTSWATGTGNYIKIYTPSNTSTEANNSQRHQGKWDNSKYRMETTYIALDALVPNVWIDGLQIQATDDAYAIDSNGDTSTDNGYLTVSNNILKGDASPTVNNYGIVAHWNSYVYLKAYNNIFYDFYSSIANSSFASINYIYNNTSYNASHSHYYSALGSADVLKNNIAQSGAGTGYDYNTGSGDSNDTSNTSSDATAPAYGNYARNASVAFADAVNKDFHLAGNDTVAREKGDDLSADSYLPFSTDINGHTRPSLNLWDIGADEGAKYIYYSVGQNTSDHKTLGAGGSAPTVTVSGYTATLDVGQTAANMGVGDLITYTGGSCYLSGKTSATVWSCQNATGGTAPQVSGVGVTSIAHAFDSLGGTNGVLKYDSTGAKDASHLNTSNIYAGNYVLNIPCYYDSGPDTTSLETVGWTTGVNNYIKIYTPTSTTTEANQSQRAGGKWDANKFSLERTTASPAVGGSGVDNIWIDGLQIRNAASGGYPSIWELSSAGSVNPNILLSNSFLWGDYSGTAQGSGIKGIAPTKIWNNIIYCSGKTVCSGSYMSGAKYIYNNTWYNGDACLRTSYLDTGIGIVKNNIFNNCTDAAIGTFGAGSGYNATDNSSMGYTVTGGAVGDRLSKSFNFINLANKDFHLTSNNVDSVINQGADLSANINFAFSTDIDGQTRAAGKWDIGADENNNVVIEVKRGVNFGKNVIFK